MPLSFSNLAAEVVSRLIAGNMDQSFNQSVIPAGVSGLGATSQTLTNARAVFVYMGQATRSWTPTNMSALVRTAASGAGQTELWLGTTANAPNKAVQALTRLASGSSTTIFAANAVCRLANSTQISRGAHVWMGIRCAYATTQIGVEAGGYAMALGNTMYWASATDLNGAGGASIGTGSLTLPAVNDLSLILRLERS